MSRLVSKAASPRSISPPREFSGIPQKTASFKRRRDFWKGACRFLDSLTPPKAMRNRAFTLIELLVVIAIIALLAGLLLNSIASALEHAHGTQDANNLHQIGIGFTVYLGDHDDTVITSGTFANILGPNSSSSTGGYVPDWHSFQSPFDKRPFTTTAPQNVSYGINTNLVGLTSGSASLSNFHSLSSLLFLGPYDKAGTGSSAVTYVGTASSSNVISPGGSIVGVMNNRNYMNVLYMDGHAGQVSASNFNNASYNPGSGNQLSLFWQPGAQ
jgi:prepilin-type N-terminal cleavage/methylation domain-containing protein/prepilin-type processing-associated H-X9-DG protein